MKFGLFYEVQTPKPLDGDDWDPGQEARKFKESLDQIELADRVGIDYIFVAEHHFTGEYTHTSAPDVFLAAASQRTKNIRLGFGVIQMPPAHNHPARVAERVSTLDIVSDGRVEFGTGIGSPAELSFFIPDLTEGRAMWRESTAECLKMMSQTPYPGHEGAYINMPVCNIVPKPVQKPHPPVWTACVRMDATVEAGHLGVGSLALALGGPAEARDRVENYWRAFNEELQPIGQAINPAVMSFVMAMCAKTDADALKRERDGAAYFNYSIGRSMELTRTGKTHIHREFVEKNATGTAVLEGRRHDFTSAAGNLIGAPETLRQRLREFEATGIDALCMTVQCGDRRHEDIMEAIELIGTQVVPEFHDRHAKHQQRRREMVGDRGIVDNSSI